MLQVDRNVGEPNKSEVVHRRKKVDPIDALEGPMDDLPDQRIQVRSEDDLEVRVSADDIGRQVGDTVRLQGPKGAAAYRVVGIAVVPGVAGNDGVGPRVRWRR